MRKALCFSIAILLCSALATEALTCKRKHKSRIGSSSINNNPSKTCIAKPGQKCKLTHYQGKFSDIFAQSCTKSIDECHLTLGLAKKGVLDVNCCDNRDLCNTP